MHADIFGDVTQDQGSQMGNTAFKEWSLEFYDTLGDFVDRTLPLVDTLD
jgi:hypothetical protein